MKRKRIIEGLNNNQRIRVIVSGVGFYTTVKDATEMPFTDQRVTVWRALEVIGREKIEGLGGQTKVYDDKMNSKTIDYQVTLL